MTGRGREPASGRDGDGAEDRALLLAHAGGDPRAFERLVRRHADRLYAVAVRTLGDREEALDALQDALLSAHRGAGGFRGDAKVSTWLHRIVVNACLDRARRRAARPVVHLTDAPSGAPGLEALPDSRDREAERDTAHDVEVALAQLPVDQRAALVLVDLHGHSVEEAARMLDCPVGTVKSRCARARARLAVLLGHLAPQPDADGQPGGNHGSRATVEVRTGRSRRGPDADEQTTEEVGRDRR